MMRGVQLLFCLFLFAACNPREIVIDKPKDLIPKDSLTSLLTDLVVLEAHIQSKYMQLNNYTEIMSKSGDSLLKKHGLTYDRFQSSMMYYGQLPHTMDTIYTNVIDTLTIRVVNLPE